jgi:hypothetical protein
MPKLIFDKNIHTGTYERRYSVGTLCCALFTMGAPPAYFNAARPWAGALSHGEELAFVETEALRTAGVLDDLVTWSKKTLVGPIAFICKEGDVEAILRRIEEWDRARAQHREQC